MAYFSAMGGAGGAGAGATLTVTYSEDFYGTTITATNGTRTLTKLATSSGSVEFKLPEDGTWTVSATVEGQLYEESVLVDTSYNTELSALPNGSTATPVNVIQTWLKCAQIRDKAYTTLSQVLNDTATLEALVSDSNACDYMVRSTNWASGIVADANAMALIGKFDYCANKLLSNSTWSTAIANSTYFESVLNVKVPTMTSDTTPSGQVIYTNQNANYPKWHVFDGNNTSNANAGGTDFTVGYKFTQPVSIKRVYHYTDNTSYKGFGTNAVLQYSDDGVTWTGSANIGGQADTQPHTAIISDNYGYHTYWRVNDDRNWFCSVLQFYGRTDTMIPLVPKMTSNTTPSGEVSASSYYDATTYPAYAPFDGNTTTSWWPSGQQSSDWVQYKFSSQKVVKKAYLLMKRGTATSQQTYTLQGSNDDFATHTDITTITVTGGSANTTYEASVDISSNTTSYQTYRLTGAYHVAGSWYNALLTLQLYTIPDYTDNVLFRSAAEDDLYYMDNGSPVIIAHTDDNGYAIVDRELLPEGVNLTVYSTVAKDPTNLGSAYSKTVHFSKYLTEVYMLPFGALYWYGYESDNCEDLNSNNGWSNAATGITWVSPSKHINYIDMTVDATNKGMGLGSKNAISSLSTLKCIMDNNISTDKLLIRTSASKSYSNAITTDFNTNPTGLQIRTVADTYGSNRYGCVMGWGLKNNLYTVKLYALLYE